MSDRRRIESILKQVENWPGDERRALAAELLSKGNGLAAKPRPSFEAARGLARGESAPPTDEDVKRLLADRRMNRFGGR